ncbi:MAG: sodium:proton antiporter [Clostridia bacterium]|nr:sodium:proton antiporter [Clostridia bacterium]
MAISALYCIPFAGMLLSIALFPILKPEFWEKYCPLIVALWSLLFVVPFAIGEGAAETLDVVLECIVGDYITFIILLFGLFCVAGNITIEGNIVGKPKTNAAVLAIGALLSSFIGTTGSSMVLIRPLMRMNGWRHRKTHLIVFFIFLVSNIGGCLTPIGDPPLLMGFSRGVPFFWSMKLFPILVVNMVILLTVFFFLDNKNYKKDLADGLVPELKVKTDKTIKVSGAHNVIFLLIIIAAVILSGYLPTLAAFQDASGAVKGLHIYEEITFTFPQMIEVALILISALLSYKTTKQEVRDKNEFTWGPIKEVALLFIGIFITMQPALIILKELGSTLSIDAPAAFFWLTGSLSSFLDNTPTYLVFLTVAGAMGFTEGVATTIGTVPVHLLEAISAGAVFMGAITYIGNAPNLMVKSIAEENKIKMPSFFGYMGWSLAILVPTFLVDMLIFFI